MTKTWYYQRVSSKGQNLDRQTAQFKELGAIDRDIISDKESGKSFERSGYLTLRNQLLREGDTLVITSLDRLGRNKALIKEELEFFKKNNIRLKILDIPTTLIDFPDGQAWVQDMVNNILIEVLGSIAENERDKIRTRQAQGIAEAKRQQKHLGRPKAEKPNNWDEVIKKHHNGEITATEAMKRLNMTRTTFYKLLKSEA